MKVVKFTTRSGDPVEIKVDEKAAWGAPYFLEGYMPHKDLCEEIVPLLPGLQGWVRLLFPNGPELEAAICYKDRTVPPERRVYVRVSEVMVVDIHKEEL